MLRTVDYHTAGEPFRIVPEPPVPLPGATVAERRMNAIASADAQRLREILCFEPRGHADMYGGLITPPDDDGADFGVLFWHKDGFSTACGHGTIALGAWAVQSGLVPADPKGSTDVVIDVPSGRVTARVHQTDGRITAVDFVNVPSRHIADGLDVATTFGDVRAALSFGGAIYAAVDATSVGLRISPDDYRDLIALGREVKEALNEHELAQHPDDDRLSGVYGTILFEALSPQHQRNVTIFAHGEVDRSPCGSGTCARLATLDSTGRLERGATLRHESIVGSEFAARVVDETPAGVIVQVTGMAYRTGEHTFEIDPDDPLVPGFVLR